MMVFRVGVLFALLCVCGPHTHAAIQPSFILDDCSWNATDVIVATEGDRIDGHVTVLEAWKGDLNPGDSIYVPALAVFASRDSRALTCKPFCSDDDDQGRPEKYVTCSRMILFLKRSAARDSQTGQVQRWDPVLKDDVKESVLWVEEGEVYGFAQVFGVGPSTLVGLMHSEQELKNRCLELARIQQSLADTVAIADRYERAPRLSPFARSELLLARTAAFDELRKCGSAATPVLQEMLKKAPTKLRNG